MKKLNQANSPVNNQVSSPKNATKLVSLPNKGPVNNVA